jgi:hypothetical protein
MSTSIARIGILSPMTEAGMKNWWKKLKEGRLEELSYVAKSQYRVRLAFRQWPILPS